MARQFTTFSVADILGHSDSGQASRSHQPSTYLQTSAQDSQQPHTSADGSTLSHRSGTVNQMLPPVALTTGSSSSADPAHQPSDNLPLPQAQRGEKRPQTKRGRKGKRPPQRSRIPSESEDSPKEDEAEDDDDVFLSSTSRRNSARNLAALAVPARDLNSAGETPSPPAPGTSAANIAAPSSSPGPSTSNTQSHGAGNFSMVVGTNFHDVTGRQGVHSISIGTSPPPQPEELEDEQPPKKKRARTAYSREQLYTMERHFRKNAYPDNHVLKIINSEAGIPIPKVQVWFQNRRAKARKWGEVVDNSTNNSALHRGIPPNMEYSRYLRPLQPLPIATTPDQPPSPPTPQQGTSPLTSPPTSAPPNLPSSMPPPHFIPSPYNLFQPPAYPLPSGYPMLQPHHPLPYPRLTYPLFRGPLPCPLASTPQLALPVVTTPPQTTV